MERIILEVDSGLAQAWRKVPQAAREQFEKKIEVSLAEQIRLAERDNYKKALKNLRNQAAQNGVTQEAIEKLLSEEG